MARVPWKERGASPTAAETNAAATTPRVWSREGIMVCSECKKLNPEVSYKGYCWHRVCLEKVFRKNIKKDPLRLEWLIGLIWKKEEHETDSSCNKSAAGLD